MIIGFEIENRSVPVYVLPLAYLAFSFLFPDRWTYAFGLGLALVLYLGSYGLGKRLSYYVFKISDQTMYFPLGLGSFLAAAYLIATFNTKPMFYYIAWSVLAILSLLEAPVLTYRFRRSYLWGVPFVLLGFWSTFTPVTFFDSMVYHLGLPYRYLANGQMSVLPFNLFTAFPPFNQVLNLLFVGWNAKSGINLFSIILYFHIISVLLGLLRLLSAGNYSQYGGNGRYQVIPREVEFEKTDLLVIPMLMLPSAWILIHVLTAELLVALFICSGVVLLVKEFDILTLRKLWVVSLLLAFSAWTKSNVFPYIFLIFILWFALFGWKFTKENLRNLGLLYGMFLLLMMPFFIRNYLQLGDPLYPAFSGIFSSKYCSVQQSIALQPDIGPGNRDVSDIFMTPLRLTFSPAAYGFAAPLGLVFLVSLLVYPFARKRKEINKILFFVLFCYLAWLFIFRDLRQFFAVLLLLGLMSYSSFDYLSKRSNRLVLACMGLCAAVSLYFLYPVYRLWFPLILPSKTAVQYLKEHLDYYPMAEKINQLNTRDRILGVGETRSAYITKPMIVPSAFDQNPLLSYLAESKSAEELLAKLRNDKIGYLLFNWSEYRRLLLKCRLLPVDLLPASIRGPLLAEASRKNLQLPKLGATQKEILQDFFSKYVSSLYRMGDSMILYEIKNPS
jgi:hypothetical protein